MRISFWLFVSFLLPLTLSAGDFQRAYDEAYAAWETAAYDTVDVNSVANLHVKLVSAWESLPEEAHERSAYDFARAGALTASKLAGSGQTNLAGSTLRKVRAVMDQYHLDLTKGRNGSFLQEVASTQAKVLASGEGDPFQGSKLSYELVRSDGGFLALQEGSAIDQTLLFNLHEMLLPREQIGTAVRMDDSGAVLEVLPIAFQDGGGEIKASLTGVFHTLPEGPDGQNPTFTRKNPALLFAAVRPSAMHSSSVAPAGSLMARTPGVASVTHPKSPNPSETVDPMLLIGLAAISTGLIGLFMLWRFKSGNRDSAARQ